MPVMTVGTGRALIPTGINYNDLVMGTQPIAYWPQSESSGLVARCLTNPAMNGTYTGVTLANDNTGPFGTPAPFFDGANDYVNVQTAALAAAFNGNAGTLASWCKVNSGAVWTDGSARYPFYGVVVAGASYFQINKVDPNAMRWRYQAGFVLETVTDWAVTLTSWMHVALTWDKAADEVKAYLNGTQDGVTQNGLGVWGANLLTTTLIGATSMVPANAWHGWLGPCAIWNRALAPAEIASLYVT